MRNLIMMTAALLMLFACKQSTTQTSDLLSVNDQKVQPIEIPDSVMFPGGICIDMSEGEIRDLVKASNGGLYTQKNQLVKHLHTRINKVDYGISLDMYRDKLYHTMYIGESKWKDVENVTLKTHYRQVFNILKELNPKLHVDSVYYRKHKEPWPFSIGYEEMIEMARFVHPLAKGHISLYLSSYEGKVSVDFAFYDLGTSREPTLTKTLYFD